MINSILGFFGADEAQPSSLSDWGFVGERLGTGTLPEQGQVGTLILSGLMPSLSPSASNTLRRALFAQRAARSRASLGRAQDEHPLQIPGQGHEAPLTANLVEPAQ